MNISRRKLLKVLPAAGLAQILALKFWGIKSSIADDRVFRHGSSLFGDLKYPPDFKHFDYVNPTAPKGGRLRLGAVGSFDSFNAYIVKGEAEGGLAYLYETLLTPSYDEVSTSYGLIAESLYYPDDFSLVTFRLRDIARWHDGKPVTAEDAIYTFNFLKDTHPQYHFYYKNVQKAEQTGPNEVTFVFDSKGNRELPNIMGQLPVLPKHYWEGTNAAGKKRNIKDTTLEPPLGSGQYRIKSFKPGQTITYERVKDYWGNDLPVNIGTNNIDELVFEYFRDREIIFEAFKADQLDVRLGPGTKEWDTGYDFPAVKNGNVVKSTFFTKGAEPMQGFVFNLRRSKFADPRVRQAFNLAYDFEGRMRVLSFGNYNKRTQSYFANTELAATGLPEGLELEILNQFRGKIPDEVFTQEYKNPVNDTPQNVRKNLRTAVTLLDAAGWEIREGKLLNKKTGERMTVEFLLDDPTFENLVLSYKPSLEKLGVQVQIRTVDSAQFQNRVREFDFDIITDVFLQSLSPGNEQREYWGSAAAGQIGSRNTIGIKDPVIDAIIDRIIFATNRAELVAASKALDRVLLWGFYMIPDFHRVEIWIPHWDRYGYPAKTPEYNVGFPNIWWWDEEKAKKIAATK